MSASTLSGIRVFVVRLNVTLDEHRGRAFCGTRPHNVNFQLGTQTVPCVRHYHPSLLHTTAAVLRPAHRRRVRRISQH